MQTTRQGSRRTTRDSSTRNGRRRSFSSTERRARPEGGRRFGRPQNGRSTNYGRSTNRGRSQKRGGPKIPNYSVDQFINKVGEHSAPEKEVAPTHLFTDFAIETPLKMAIESRGFHTPSPIQDKTIPVTLTGRDVVGLANTGTGKTAAFLVPLLNKVLLNPKEKIIILAPTRELAIQIQDELKRFVAALPSRTRIFSVTCVGGVNIGPQIRALKQHNHFVIGTPGRIMDLMKQKKLSLGQTHTIVLDEADRMLDMGFINDMRFILSHMPNERQTLFFSATLAPEIKNLVHDFLKNPEIISVKKRDTSKNIDQDVVRLAGRDKVAVLIEILRDPALNKVLVFGQTKRGVEKLSKQLCDAGIKTDAIHGNKSNGQRMRALKGFAEGRTQVLTATDVAARGLDITNVTHVINFDLPQSYDDYIHRIGRTGRGDKMGHALTFVG